MWPFRKQTSVVTSRQVASAVLDFMQRCGKTLSADLQKETEKAWSLTPDEIATLDHEVLVAHLWGTSRAITRDQRVLDALHDAYFESCYHSGATHKEGAARANAAQGEVSERYDQYYKAWKAFAEAKRGFSLGSEMCQFFFPRRRPVMNAHLFMLIQIHVLSFMKSVVELRKEFEVKDT